MVDGCALLPCTQGYVLHWGMVHDISNFQPISPGDPTMSVLHISWGCNVKADDSQWLEAMPTLVSPPSI